MEIDISLEDYFKELDLMDKQYGQEEELYPLVNMILRANCNLDGLSLRDVHNHNSTKMKHSLLYGYAGFSDLVILGRDYCPDEDYHNINKHVEKMYGCVEIKTSVADIENLNEGYNKRYINGSQVIGQLAWYGKTIYTNGYMWRYLELDESGVKRLDFPKVPVKDKNENIKGFSLGRGSRKFHFRVKTICNLNEDKQLTDENKKQWNCLKQNLKKIDWTKPNNFDKFL